MGFHGATVSQPNEFELKYRPTHINHLPPLSAPWVGESIPTYKRGDREVNPALSEIPKIVEHGSYTQAVPVKQKQLVRGVSDCIGSNYSPRASHLSTSHIYETTKQEYLLSVKPDNDGPSSVIVLPRNLQVVTFVSCVPSMVMVSCCAATEPAGGDMYELCSINGDETTLEIQNEAIKDELEISGNVKDESNELDNYESHISGLLNSDRVEIITEEEINELECFTDTEEETKALFQLNDVDIPSHDKQTQECLDIEFPPWYFSTHGLSRPSSPTAEEKERYFLLAEKAIDPSMVGPITKEMLEELYHFVPRSLRIKFPNASRAFLKEMDFDYRSSVRRAILDYILLDKSEQQRLGLLMPYKPSNLAGRNGFPWHDNLTKAKEFIQKDLFITHLVMREILYDFNTRFQDFRLIDIAGLKKIMPVTMEDFINHVKASSKQSSEILQNVWLADCANMMDQMRDDIEAWMPTDMQERIIMMEHFFNSVASLMSVLLRQVVECSIQDLVNLIENYAEGNLYEGDYDIMSSFGLPIDIQPIKIFLKEDVENSSLQFSPTITETCDFFSLIIDTLIISVQKLNRIEQKLFQDAEDTKTILSVEIDEEIVEAAKDKIRSVLLANSHGPKQ
ncbi:hypothetical protein Btru_057282 [Bulinus truncatus]|nr:hypothetical protein Btru_057282 [Bulinus truncatus]